MFTNELGDIRSQKDGGVSTSFRVQPSSRSPFSILCYEVPRAPSKPRSLNSRAMNEVLHSSRKIVDGTYQLKSGNQAALNWFPGSGNCSRTAIKTGDDKNVSQFIPHFTTQDQAGLILLKARP